MLRKGDEPIPGYRLEEFLGRGQFGEVWRTTAPGGTSAALKFIDLSGTRGLKEYRGIQRVKEIRHAHLMPITALWMLDVDGEILSDRAVESYDPQETARDTLAPQFVDAGEQPGWLVVAMLLGDKNLLDRLDEGQQTNEWGIPIDELLIYMEEAAKGIDFLNSPQHDLGEGPVAIQHCDIKPANIMLVGDSVVICDFGLARMLGDAAATATGMVGSPAYMAPECINRKPSHATDQYSLAVTYIELRTGQLPFEVETYMAILDAHRHGTLDLSRLGAMERDVIRKATSVNPEDRYASCVEMVRALRRAFEKPSQAKPRRSSGLLVAVVFAFLLAGVASVFHFLRKGSDVHGGDPSNPAATSAKDTITLAIVPREAKLVVDGEERSLDANGETAVEMESDHSMEIEVSGSEDYAPIIRSYTRKQLQEIDFRIELDHSARYFVKRAYEDLESGAFADAVEQYRQAILRDGGCATPTPIELRMHTAAVRGLAISPSANPWLVSASDDGTACASPLLSGRPPEKHVTLRGHDPDTPIECLAVGPNGRWVITGGWDNKALLWDLSAADPAEKPIVLKGHTEDIVAVAVVPSRDLAVTASFDSTVRLWDMRSDTSNVSFVALEGHACEIERLIVSPDSQWLVSIDAASGAKRWDLTSEDPASSMAVIPELSHRVKTSLATPDSQWLVTGGDDGSVAFTNLDELKNRWMLPALTDKDVESLAVGPRGERLVVGAEDGVIRVWPLTGGPPPAAPQAVLNQHVEAVVSLAVSADARWALSGSWDKVVCLWDLDAKDPSTTALRLTGHVGPVHAVVVSGDGNWAASSDESGLILLWNLPACLMIQEAATELEIPAKPRVEA